MKPHPKRQSGHNEWPESGHPGHPGPGAFHGRDIPPFFDEWKANDKPSIWGWFIVGTTLYLVYGYTTWSDLFEL
jgi:hypothetical protein